MLGAGRLLFRWRLDRRSCAGRGLWVLKLVGLGVGELSLLGCCSRCSKVVRSRHRVECFKPTQPQPHEFFSSRSPSHVNSAGPSAPSLVARNALRPLHTQPTMSTEVPWHAEFPTPTSKPALVTAEELYALVSRSKETAAPSHSSPTFLVVDVRRTDFDVRRLSPAYATFPAPFLLTQPGTADRVHPDGRQPPRPILLPDSSLAPSHPLQISSRHLPLPVLQRTWTPSCGVVPGRLGPGRDRERRLQGGSPCGWDQRVGGKV